MQLFRKQPITATWGRNVWLYLATIASSFEPTRDTSNMKHLLLYVARTLPCPKCRGHFEKSVSEMDFNDFASKSNLLQWVHARHSAIRIQQGRQPTDFDSWLYELEHGELDHNLIVIIILVIVILLLACKRK